MSGKTLRILIITLLILVGLTVWRIKTPRFSDSSSNAYVKKVQSIQTDTISAITITKADKTVKLEKKDAVWMLNGKKASSQKAETLINSLITSAVPEVVSENDARYEEFGIATTSATRVAVDDKLTVIAGKTSTTGTYARLDGETVVYDLTNLSASDLSTDPAEWYDKTIVNIEEKDMTKLTFHRGVENFSLIQEESVWKIEDGKKETEREKIAPFLTTLSSFTAQKLAAPEDGKQFAGVSLLTLTIEKKDGKETLTFFKALEETDHLIKRGSDGVQFIASEYQVKDFLIPLADITKKS